VRGGIGGLGLKSLSSESAGDDVTEARELMKLGFGGIGGFDLPLIVSELTLRRTAGGS
jgi:hypothetical protein